MDELLGYLCQLNAIIIKQIDSFQEFIHILDKEEQAISTYKFSEIEKSIIIKDQHVKFAENLENKRINLLKKICYMIAFDYRGQKLSLALFKTVFSTYLLNVKNLLSPAVYEKIEEQYKIFLNSSNLFQDIFGKSELRINRNSVILKKLIKHVNFSIHILQSEFETGLNYDSLGKAQSALNQAGQISSIRVTV